MEKPSVAERRAGLLLLVAALAVGGLLRLWLALTEIGVFHSDEIFQSLEPAHWLIFGYGLLPWEFVQGARSWAFPGFCAALLELASLIGLGQPAAYLSFIRI